MLPEMKYEMLVRRVWGTCGRMEDPDRIANADFYDNHIMHIEPELRIAISNSIAKGCEQVDELKFGRVINELAALKVKVFSATKQEQIVQIIEAAHKLLNEAEIGAIAKFG